MKKLIIWMIDDEPIYHKQAREGLANVAKQLPVTCVIKSLALMTTHRAPRRSWKSRAL